MKKIPLLLDKPLDDVARDQFGHEHYAEILFDLITNKELQMPYNIGLLGQWGVGKSSIKELCKNKLKTLDNILCIDFNAWKYSGDSVKKALLRDIYLEIGGSDEKIKDEFSRHITRQVQELCNNRELCNNLKNFFYNWSQIILLNFFLYLGYYKILPHLEAWGEIISTISFASISVLLTKTLLSKNNMLLPVFQNITKMDIPSATTEVYESFLRKQIDEYKKMHNNIDKIVVFIDDLDRLPTAQEMVEGINTIRSFMDIKTNKEIGFIFVVSCCEYKISDALITINSNKLTNNDNNYAMQIDAKRFLDKIFHFRIDIPPFPYRDMIEYSKNIIKTQIPDFAEFENILIQSGTNLENLLCRLMHPAVQSPRQAIQILNTFFQSWNIALKRENDEITDKAGGLAAKIVTGHPLTLAILSVLKVDFPYFYKELLKEPKLLKYVLEILTTKQEPQLYIDLKIKAKFVEKISSNKDAEETERFRIKSEFHDLKNYLNIIKNQLELPVSLKPFLLLNQDGLSRKYGEQAFEIENALIQNNCDKLIKILKIQDEKLSVETARLLKSVYESIQYDLHKKNAFQLLSKLIPFIGENTVFLIDSFADTLNEDPAYRELLQINDYKSLLNIILPSKANKIIFALKQKYMQKFLYSEETENNRNKEIDFKKAANIILEYCNTHNYVDNETVEWVLNPIIANTIEEPVKALSLGFLFILDVFSKYEFLYAHKSKEYINVVMKEFTNGKSIITEENEANVLQTFEKSLDYVLKNQNEEFNNISDDIMDQDNTKLYKYIIDYTEKNLGNCKDTNLNNYLIQLDVAIENKLNNVIKAELDIQELLINFNNLLNIYYNRLEKESYDYIDALCSVIISNENYTNEIIETINILKNNNYINISKMHELIINQLFKFNPESENIRICLNYLFNNYKNLSNENKIILAQNYANFIMDTSANSLEEYTFNAFKQYISIILADNEERIATIFSNKFVDFANNYLLPNEEYKYFEQLLSLLPILSLGSKDKIKDFIILILEDKNFAHMYSDKIGQFVTSCGENIWNNDNRIVETFNRIISENINNNQLDCAISLYNTITILQNQTNIENLYHLILNMQNTELQKKLAWLIKLPKEKIYTTDEFIQLIMRDEYKEQSEHIKQLCEHFLNIYTTNERKYILLKFLYSDTFLEFFKIILNAIYNITGEYTELYEIIDENSQNNNINKLLSRRALITDMLLGENRKEPSRILLLNTKVIDETVNIENKYEIITQMLKWSYDLYNDIIRDTEIRGFSDPLKELINKIFEGKTFGRIRYRNK